MTDLQQQQCLSSKIVYEIKKYNVQFFTQKKMDISKNKNFRFFNGIKYLAKWARRAAFIIIAVFIISLSNIFNDEYRWINNVRNFDQQKQVIEKEETYE
jgi:hypothetical protein